MDIPKIVIILKKKVMKKLTVMLLSFFLVSYVFSQTKSIPNPKTETYTYNGKKVSYQQLLKLLNRDLVEFCKKEKKLKKS